MSQQYSVVSGSARSDEIARAIERVYAMKLTGLPRVLVLDAAAIWDGVDDDEFATAIVEKVRLLAAQDALHVIVLGIDPWQAEVLEQAIPHEYLTLARRNGEEGAPQQLPEQAISAPASVAVLAAPGIVIPDGCTAFYVAEGEAPPRASTTHLRGAQATDSLLTLYGTALMQERAGIAFRAISEGKSIPQAAPTSTESLTGVTRAVSWSAAPMPARRHALPDEAALRALASRAYARLLRNVLPDGAVVGSPAHGQEPGQPNYWFYWQRDGAVTMGHLIAWQQQPLLGLPTSGLDAIIARYPAFVARTQRQGDLGTSRYTTDGDPITGFGNPQLDGPPLSAMTLARMAPRADVWGLLRAYLDFLLTPEGCGPGMDAWEFIYGQHFNAAFLKRRALLVGASVASQLGHADDARRYTAEARHLENILSGFIDPQLGRLRAFTATYDPWFTQMSGLDAAVLCAVLSGRDLYARGTSERRGQPNTAGLGRDLDAVTSPVVLATMSALEEAFASRYAVNRDWTAAGNSGFGLGRFPEDANDGVGTSGGNPWPLATLWGAQFYYSVVQEIAQVLQVAEDHSLALDDARQATFLQRATGQDIPLARPIAAAHWRTAILPRVLACGDGYLNFVVHHLPEDGGVTEQIDGETGAPRGARDLSWALSELIATLALREEVGRAL